MVLTYHELDLNSRRGQASIFQVAPREVPSGCKGPA